MKLKYIGFPNETMFELTVAGVIGKGEALEVDKIYDIPTDDTELNRKMNDLVKAGSWKRVSGD